MALSPSPSRPAASRPSASPDRSRASSPTTATSTRASSRCARTASRTSCARGKIVIVAGYQGMSYRREITTLGRGGSDTTAVALAAALRPERCEIYSDVDGVYSADPRVVPEARHLPEIGLTRCRRWPSAAPRCSTRRRWSGRARRASSSTRGGPRVRKAARRSRRPWCGPAAPAGQTLTSATASPVANTTATAVTGTREVVVLRAPGRPARGPSRPRGAGGRAAPCPPGRRHRTG